MKKSGKQFGIVEKEDLEYNNFFVLTLSLISSIIIM